MAERTEESSGSREPETPETTDTKHLPGVGAGDDDPGTGGLASELPAGRRPPPPEGADPQPDEVVDPRDLENTGLNGLDQALVDPPTGADGEASDAADTETDAADTESESGSGLGALAGPGPGGTRERAASNQMDEPTTDTSGDADQPGADTTDTGGTGLTPGLSASAGTSADTTDTGGTGLTPGLSASAGTSADTTDTGGPQIAVEESEPTLWVGPNLAHVPHPPSPADAPIPIPDPDVPEGADKTEPATKLDSDAKTSDESTEKTDPGFGKGTDTDGPLAAGPGKDAFGSGGSDRIRVEGTETELMLDPMMGNMTKDSDGDGLGDDYETNVVGTDPDNPDTDGDGFSDGVEHNAWGSDPTLDWSHPHSGGDTGSGGLGADGTGNDHETGDDTAEEGSGDSSGTYDSDDLFDGGDAVG